MNILARLAEPSTYAALAVILALISAPLGDMVTTAATPLAQIAAGVMAVIAAFKKDPGSEE